MLEFFCNYTAELACLPPANEVWRKVIFSEASVILSRGPLPLPGPTFLLREGVFVLGPMFLLGVLCSGSLCPRGLFQGCLCLGVSVHGWVSVQGAVSVQKSVRKPSASVSVLHLFPQKQLRFVYSIH